MKQSKFFKPKGWKSDVFKTSDGRTLRYGHVSPRPGTKIKGTVVLTTGYGGFTEGYYETIHNYLKRGYSVWAMDWYGHGGSERADPNRPMQPEKDRPSIHIKDLHHFATNVVKHPKGKRPMILSTHSMGGLIGLHYLKKHEGVFDYAVMAAPMVDIGTFGFPKWIAKPYIRAMNSLGMGDRQLLPANDYDGRMAKISRRMNHPGDIRTKIKRMQMAWNPRLRLYNPTYSWLTRALSSIESLNKEKYLKKIKTPVLMGIGGRDRVVDNRAAERAAELMENSRILKMPAGGHFLWTEKDETHEQWWNEIDGFMTLQLTRWTMRKEEQKKLTQDFTKSARGANKDATNDNPENKKNTKRPAPRRRRPPGGPKVA